MGGSPGCGEDVGCIQMICPSLLLYCVCVIGARGGVLSLMCESSLPSPPPAFHVVCVCVCVCVCLYVHVLD